MNKQEKYKVLNFSNSVCFLTCNNRSYSIAPWKSGIPGFANIPFEEIEYAAARTPLFRSGVLGFEEKHKADLYKELHIDEENVWTREKIYQLLKEGDKELQQMLLNTTDRVTMSWIRGETLHISNTEDTARHSMVSLVEKRNIEILRGHLNSKLVLDDTPVEENASVKREEFESMKQKNEELSKQIAELLALLKAPGASPVAEATESTENKTAPEVVEKAPAKRGPKKKE